MVALSHSWARPVFKCQCKGDPSVSMGLVVLIFSPVAVPVLHLRATL